MICKEGYKLVYVASGLYVHMNDPINFQQEPGWMIVGGQPPQHESSTGRVYLRNMMTDQNRTYFPNVAGCKWILFDAPTEERRKA